MTQPDYIEKGEWREKAAELCWHESCAERCDNIGLIEDLLIQVREEAIKECLESLPKKKKTCGCETSIVFGYHTKECNFMPDGFNLALAQTKENLEKLL